VAVSEFPQTVRAILERLSERGHEAYVVGGAVRDLCMGRPVTDWDIVTSAAVQEIASLFGDLKSFTLKHETITLVQGKSHYEVSAFRTERLGGKGIEADLAHRDFTMNAMAQALGSPIVDPFGGRRNIEAKLIRAVGDPEERLAEDPLRLMRSVRFAAELGFRIDPGTRRAVQNMANRLASVASERVRDELVKLLVSPKPSGGILLMKSLGLLQAVIPELLEGVGMRQNPSFHRFTVFRHILETVDRVKPTPDLRVAALLHDIAKPRVREKIAGKFRFYGHAGESARLAREIMVRLKFGNDAIDRVSHLIANHMRDLDYHQGWSDAAVRRLIRAIGEENLPGFFSLREADIHARGVLDERLPLFRELKTRISGLLETTFPRSACDLAIDGRKVMEALGLGPGPEVGRALRWLVEKTTDHPEWNTEAKLVELLRSGGTGQSPPTPPEGGTEMQGGGE
jgi:tRNA nucleotidyltransferase (CCA-adding enzyme)